MRRFFILFLLVGLTNGLLAQSTDSVTITGRIKNLTVRLYRQSPTVSVSRNNILQPNEELVRPGALEPDGRFRLTLPLVFPYEEMYFRFGNVSTVFLATPGTVEITLDADSLYAAEVPFRFGGELAGVNQALARYKAYEFKNRPKTDNRRLAGRVDSQPARNMPSVLMTEFMTTYNAYLQKNQVPALLTDYQTSLARSEAAIYLYEKFLAENLNMSKEAANELMPLNDPFLTTPKVIAYDRMGDYYDFWVGQRTSVQGGRSVPAPVLAGLLLQYGTRLDETERTRLAEIVERKAAQGRDMTLLNRALSRHADTLANIVSYESYRSQIIQNLDSIRTAYLLGRILVRNFPDSELNKLKTLYAYAAPQISMPQYRQSLDELYRLQVKDSVAIETVKKAFRDKPTSQIVTEVLPGVMVLQGPELPGSQMMEVIRRQASGRLAYIVSYTNAEASNRLAALQARQLAQEFSARDLLIVYFCAEGGERDFWLEWVAKNRPMGLNVFAVNNQAVNVLTTLRAFDFPGATLMGRDGKFIKRGAPLPDKMDEVIRLIRANL